MARRLPTIEAEVAPLDVNGTEATRAWVRATEILIRAKARRDARLLTEAEYIEHGDSPAPDVTAPTLSTR